MPEGKDHIKQMKQVKEAMSNRNFQKIYTKGFKNLNGCFKDSTMINIEL